MQHRKRLPRELLGEFLVKLDAYDGDFITRMAIHFTVLAAVRTREIIQAEWTEFEQLDDPHNALWRIPSSRMKMRTEHLVPLSRGATIHFHHLYIFTTYGARLGSPSLSRLHFRRDDVCECVNDLHEFRELRKPIFS